jgi:hypothetical protein
MPLRAQPGDQLHKIRLRHRRTASRRSIYTAPDMEENRAAGSWDRRIGIVPNLDEPVIRKIARAHSFVRVIFWRIPGINHDMPIVIRRARVIAPNVRFRHLMVWIVGSGRQLRLVSEDLPDLEYSRRRSSISLLFPKTGLVLSGKACSPGNSFLSKQNR